MRSKRSNNTINGVDLTYTYHYKGDVVTRQDADNIIPINRSVSNEEQARKVIDPIGAAYSKIKGVTHSVDYKEHAAQEHLSIDFNQAKISELCHLPGGQFYRLFTKVYFTERVGEIAEIARFKEVK